MIGVSVLVALALGLQIPAAGVPVDYTLHIYAPGVDPAHGAPVQQLDIPAMAVVCNQDDAPPAPSPADVALNPTRVSWDDPAHPGKRCAIDKQQFFLTLPVIALGGGGYIATLTAVDSVGQRSPRSTPSNLFRPDTPLPAPTNVRIVK